MDVESYAKGIEIARSSRYVIPTFGIHPWEAHRYCDRLGEIEPYLKATPLIGEAGLDFHWVEDKSRYPCQIAVFEHQCAWARRLSKPMNLHTKGAENEVLAAIRRFGIVRPIIHWYSGPTELIDSYLRPEATSRSEWRSSAQRGSRRSRGWCLRAGCFWKRTIPADMNG